MLKTKDDHGLVVDPENLYLTLLNASEEYNLNQVVNEAMLEMDEEHLHHFLAFGLTFFLGWILSGFFQ